MAKKRSNKSKKRNFTKPNWKKSVRRDVERQEQARNSYGFMQLPKGVPTYNPKPGGRSQLDFLPYIVTDENHPDRYDDEGIAVPGSLWYKRPFKFHRNIGPESDTVVCPTSAGKACPICEYRQQRFKEGASADEVRDIKPSSRNLYVVIPIGDKEHEEVPHIMEMSHFNFQELLNEELEEWEENNVFPDLEEGKTLRIRWASSTVGDSKPFAEASRIDFRDRKKPYDENILDDIPNLDDVLEILGYKQLEAKFMELDPEDLADEPDDDWEEEEETPAPKRRKKSAKPEPEPEEEEEEDWEEEEDEDVWDEDEEFEEEVEEDWEEEDDDFFEEEDDDFFEEEVEEDWEEEDDDFFEEEDDDFFEEEEDWEEEFEDDEPEPEPKPKKKSKKKSKKKPTRRKK